ncbi:MAG: 1-phosphofructokinase [Armatimonadota bacterium]
MILSVTPNASIDITYIVEGFGVDKIHKPKSLEIVAGGKGINIARVLKELNTPSMATGFIGGKNGDIILNKLSEEKIQNDFVRVGGESRTCIKIVDPKNSTQTEINETGPVVTNEDSTCLLNKIDELLSGVEFLVLSGSCPPGLENTYYADIIKHAKNKNVRVVLDASGEQLAEAVKAVPYIFKPNVLELSELTKKELYTQEEVVKSAQNLIEQGIKIVAVTMGRSGAIVTDGREIWHATPPEINFVSAVGSGDAFIAAFLDTILRGESISSALVWGISAGAANACTHSAGFVKKEDIEQIREDVILSRLSI